MEARQQDDVRQEVSWRDADLLHKVPRSRLVDRADELSALSAGRRVIHIGFVDDRRMRREIIDQYGWLHERLSLVTDDLVGLDVNEQGVERARALGYEAHVVDCRSAEEVAALGIEAADVVIAGEVLEHLDAPGAFLDGIEGLLRPEGRLVVTTPNATRMMNFLAVLAGRDFTASDHVMWQSWHTLKALLAQHGWEIVDLSFYVTPSRRAAPDLTAVARLRVLARNLLRALLRQTYRLRPALADGLFVVARRTGGGN